MVDINGRLADFRRRRPSLEDPVSLMSILKELASQYYASDPHLDLLKKILDHLFFGNEIFIDTKTLSKQDAMYVASIMAMGPHIGSRMFVDHRDAPVSAATQDTDFLVTNIDEWPLFKLVNFALLLSIRPSKRAAIVTSIRNEGVSILEWVAHHRALGFEEIFVYTNNNTDGSNPLLETLAKTGVIRLIHNTVDSSVAPQTKAYEHCLHFLPALRQYRWVFFIDADEFFISRCGPNLNLDDLFQKMKDHFPKELPAAISFNWKWFGSENAFDRTKGLLLRRFEHSIHNEHVKTLVQLDRVLTMKPVHCPAMFSDSVAVDSQFNELKAVTMKTTPVYGVGQINHYWNKSFQEFVMKKFRGRGAVGTGGAQREFSMFFDWGANDRRGNFDPPPLAVTDRTQAAYNSLLEIPGIADELAAINALMDTSIAEMDKDLNLKQIYENRGRAET